YGSRRAAKPHEPRKAMRWLWLSLLLLFVDQASKYPASTMLAHGESVPAAPFFNWVHRHNTGAAFSFLADVGGWQQPLFIGLALVISILLVYWLWRSPRSEEHTSELQSRENLVCRRLHEKKTARRAAR